MCVRGVRSGTNRQVTLVIKLLFQAGVSSEGGLLFETEAPGLCQATARISALAPKSHDDSSCS